MTLAGALASTTFLFLDTAPVIYFVEEHPLYLPLVEIVFDRADSGELRLATSPVTLAECLVLPLRQRRHEIVQAFAEVIVNGPQTRMHTIDHQIALQAAALRAEHNLSLLDALQAAVAIAAGCDALLTNDPVMQRVPSLRVLLLDDFVP